MVEFYNHPQQDINWLIQQPGAVYTLYPGTDVLHTLTWDETYRGDYSRWYFSADGFLTKKEMYTGRVEEGKTATRILTYTPEGTLSDWRDPTAPHFSNRDSIATYDTPTLDYGYTYVRADPGSTDLTKVFVDSSHPSFSVQPVYEHEQNLLQKGLFPITPETAPSLGLSFGEGKASDIQISQKSNTNLLLLAAAGYLLWRYG